MMQFPYFRFCKTLSYFIKIYRSSNSVEGNKMQIRILMEFSVCFGCVRNKIWIGKLAGKSAGCLFAADGIS